MAPGFAGADADTGPGTGFTVTSAGNLAGALSNLGLVALPASWPAASGSRCSRGSRRSGPTAGGLTTFVVLGVRGSAGRDLVPDAVSAGGTPLAIAGGAGAEISAPLINAIVVRPPGFFFTFLLAGTVSTQLLEQAAADLTELVTPS